MNINWLIDWLISVSRAAVRWWDEQWGWAGAGLSDQVSSMLCKNNTSAGFLWEDLDTIRAPDRDTNAADIRQDCLDLLTFI